MDDVARDIARQKLEQDLKGALSIRELVWAAIQRGERLEYLSMRYGVPLETLQHAKKEADRRQEARKRAAVVGRDTPGLRGSEQPGDEKTMGRESSTGVGA